MGIGKVFLILLAAGVVGLLALAGYIIAL